MKKPSEEQIEEIIKELPHPRDWPGDFYKLAWQYPEELDPIRLSRELECTESYIVELLFRRVVNANGYGMSWELDEGFKSFDEFVAEQTGQSQAPVDEYGIIEILKKHNAESALPEVAAKFDSICTQYMRSRERIEKSAFTKVNCYLMQAIIDCEGDDSALRQRIELIIEGLGKEIEAKEL